MRPKNLRAKHRPTDYDDVVEERDCNQVPEECIVRKPRGIAEPLNASVTRCRVMGDQRVYVESKAQEHTMQCVFMKPNQSMVIRKRKKSSLGFRPDPKLKDPNVRGQSTE